MSRPTYIVLHKTEWERLKNQGNRDEAPIKRDEREEYFKGLIETSQEWINSWPDSVAGHVAHAKEENEKHHIQDMALIKTYKKHLQRDNTKAIQDARQIIFDKSCYGKQLWGALIESKVLEEREAQIIFNNKLKEKQRLKETEQLNMENRQSIAANEKEMIKQKQKRMDALECVKINKEIEKQNIEKLAKLKEAEKCYLIDDKLIKEVRDKEKKLEEEIKAKQAIELKQFEAEQKAIEHQRILQNRRDDVLTELYRKERERLKSKMDKVRKKMIDHSHASSNTKHVYELIDKNLKEKQKAYDEFVEKGIKRCEEREKKLDEQTKPNKSKLNQNISPVKFVEDNGKSWCKCDRSSLFVKSRTGKQSNTSKKDEALSAISDKNKLDFLKPKNPLLEAPNHRSKEKSPFTGTQKEHAQFAEQASKVLQDCKYKNYARKIVDKYRKLNNLDATTLPVPNY